VILMNLGVACRSAGTETSVRGPNLTKEMSSSPVPTSIARVALAITAWLRTRAFVAPPAAWRLLCGCAFGLTVALFLVSAWIPAVTAAAVAAGTIQPLFSWRRLRAISAQPAIALARFSNANPAYEDIATVHIQEVERRLRNNALLANHSEIRILEFPVTVRQARRILRLSPITGVLSGKGLAVGGSVRWEGWGLLRSPGGWFRSVTSSDRAPRIIDREVGIDRPEETNLKPDTEVPASKLTAEIFSADHALALEGILLAHVAAWTADAIPASAKLRSEAEQLSAHLPLSVSAQLAATRVRLQLVADGDLQRAIGQLESLGDGELPHWRIWDYCFTLMLEDMERFSARDRLRVVEKGARASPEHALALANLGATLLVFERRAEARDPLSSALDRSSGDAPAHFYPAVMANSFMAGGDQDDWHRWRRHFRRVLKRDRPGLRAQLGLTNRSVKTVRPPSNFGSWPQ